MKAPYDPIELDQKSEEALINRIKKRECDDSDFALIIQIVRLYTWMRTSLANTKISLKVLKKMLFGKSSEKQSGKNKNNSNNSNNSNSSNNNTGANGSSSQPTDAGDSRPPATPQPAPSTSNDHNSSDSSSSDTEDDQDQSAKAAGHGRIGVDEYSGAQQTIHCTHDDLKAGMICPKCARSRLYKAADKKAVALAGNALISAIIYVFEVLRCNCGFSSTAPFPSEQPYRKYNAELKAVLALSHFYMGLPYKRIELFQEMQGIPLPDATQADLVKEVTNITLVLYECMKQFAANQPLMHQDDTGVKILSLIKQNRSPEPPKRTGMYTTGILSIGEHRIVLFISGRQHAGENLDALLDLRDYILPPIIQMADGLSANNPKHHCTILCNCLAHARRKFFEIKSSFPDECAHVLGEIAKVYQIDRIAKDNKLSDKDRLALHQAKSAPIMYQLKEWLETKLDQLQIEDSSRLGTAIKYTLKRWQPLSRFLWIPGIPLDNNPGEQILKVEMRYRNNSIFFANEDSARRADSVMSLAETCRQNQGNPLEYFTAITENEQKVLANPALWMPWNYTRQLNNNSALCQELSQPPPITRHPGTHGIPIPE